ncbi:MAG: hypothetical protein V4724_19205 [Pseudomonadota bacterium]
MAFIPLNRRFTRWDDSDNTVMNWYRFYFQHNRDFGWRELLREKRVVILAEGGSGKTTEFEACNEVLQKNKLFSFLATVKKVGSDCFESALGSRDKARLKKWIDSNEPAWFFVDSIDEAKLESIPFRDALNHLADAISGAEDRAHIIISGRHTDWEAIRDHDDLERLLPAHSQATPSENRPNALLLQALKLEPDNAPKIERPLVVVMAPLDVDQIRIFVVQSGVADVDSFVASVESARLWPFASRPVDLDWLVGYWKKNGRFGALAGMLQLNLSDRLREQDPKRERRALLSDHGVMQALERTGAALVLGKKDTISLVGKGRKPGDKGNGISLADLLSDHPPSERIDLINRAVFVPAKAGSTRLHNDNTGTVRAFLCAKWIVRLRDNNLPINDLLRLLFATTYDVDVVRPAMRETAAWLAIDNSAVAREILKRDPLLLMQAGDPSSLPRDVREQALALALQALADQPHNGASNRDALRRFVGDDMDDAIRKHWQSSHRAPGVARILLELIEAGELVGCVSIALDAAQDMSVDSQSRILAIKALATLNLPEALAEYRKFLLTNYKNFEHDFLWFAVNSLFPSALSVDDLIAMSSALSIKGSGRSLDYHGPKLARQMKVSEDVLQLLRHFISKLSHVPEDMTDPEFEEAQPSLNIMKALAVRSLDLRGSTAPSDWVSMLQIWLDLAALRHPVHEGSKIDLQARLRSEPELRQAWLWQAVKIYSASKIAQIEPLEKLSQLRFHLAFTPRLLAEDAAWLIQDLQTREASGEKMVIFELLREVCYNAGNPMELVKETKEAACQYPVLRPTLGAWEPLPSKTSPEIQLSHEAQQQEAERLSNEENRSWIEFANFIREHPKQTRDWAILANGNVDPRLVKLWTILTKDSEEGLLNATPDIKTLSGIFESDVVDIIRDVFISSWRSTTPTLEVDGASSMYISKSYADLIGFAGVSLEAKADPDWAAGLDSSEAHKAAVYATLAFDAFPDWMADLCVAHPQICAGVIHSDLARDLDPGLVSCPRRSLARIARSDQRVAALIESDIWNAIEASGATPIDLLSSLLGILLKVTTERERLLQLIARRISDLNAIEVNIEYLAAGFSIDADKTTELLFGLLARLDARGSAAIARPLIPRIFGKSMKSEPPIISQISIENLEKLILFAYSSIPLSEDVQRPVGIAFTPDERDSASQGRQQALQLLADTSGKGSHSALGRLIEMPDFPVVKSYLKNLARKRVERDSEIEAWEAADVLLFETKFTELPRKPEDLQRLAANRLADIQYDLMDSDRQQARTVAILENERQVQLWFADRFWLNQGTCFSIDRESLVADEKAPDLRLRAKASDASLPIEIKIAESWSRHQLEEALTVQLQGRYLRDRNDRWGILLLVYQKLRPQGWEGPNGEMWAFSEVVAHLARIANDIAAKDSLAPQMLVCVIDVSSTTPTKPTKARKPRAKKAAPKAT